MDLETHESHSLWQGKLIRLQDSLGFQLEGRLRRMVYTDGGFHDEMVYGLTIEEFREKYLPSM